MEVTFSPCHSSSFIFSSEAPASEPSSPRGRRAGSQARPKLGEVGQPQAEDHVPPHPMFHVSRSVVRRARGPGRTWGGEVGKKLPTSGPPTEQGGGSPRSWSPSPWTGLGRKERKELHQQPQSRTHRAQGVGGQREKWEEERKADRRQDALRRSLKVASAPDATIWGAWR